ncbi:MAG: rhodanese-like domain-containing protein [Proteobacteria bacterium]|nr:rhodanese-like domain-containing protein [Ramlibacter sp.]MCA0212383.1 rhodanese-like domain-containing protein [Pseudomonadota bacterium]
MKFLMDNWMLIAVAFASGALLMWPMVTRGMRVGSLTPNAAVQLINREKAVVVDVSETEEFAGGHIVGSKNIPLGQFEEKLPDVVKNKALPLILVCPVGARANRALAMAKKLGYEQAQVLGGGLNAWKEASLPVEKA